MEKSRGFEIISYDKRLNALTIMNVKKGVVVFLQSPLICSGPSFFGIRFSIVRVKSQAKQMKNWNQFSSKTENKTLSVEYL